MGDVERRRPETARAVRARQRKHRFRGPKYRPTFIRQHREHRGLTLEGLAERLGTTHASLSRIERGLQPYGQELLERLANVLTAGDVCALLVRDPADPEGIWSVWEELNPEERRQIVEIAKALIRGRLY